MPTSSAFAFYPSLQGKTVLVTGGATGIGASMVEHFHDQGGQVAFLDIDEAEGRSLSQRLGRENVHFLPCDLRDILRLRACIAEVCERFGPPAVLVNNAARDDRHLLSELSPEIWDEAMAVNLRHQFFAAQAVAPGMKALGGGSIVNLGSTAWIKGLGGMPAYATAKAAINGMTRALARELGRDNIRVNAILPGAVMTKRQRAGLASGDEDRLLREQCLARLLSPADVARLALFLAADDSGMCTSQTFIIDGGWV